MLPMYLRAAPWVGWGAMDLNLPC